MANKRQPRDFDAEIAHILKIAEQNNAQTPLVIPTPSANPLTTPTIKWVARIDEDDPHADT